MLNRLEMGGQLQQRFIEKLRGDVRWARAGSSVPRMTAAAYQTFGGTGVCRAPQLLPK